MFPYAHATHPQWPMAAALVLAQLQAQMVAPDYVRNPTLALLYITDHYAHVAQDILDHLSAELPEITDWSGTVGIGIASNNVEYFDQPALAVMLCELPSDQYRVFSGVAPLSLGFEAHSALLHADANTSELPELIEEMALRTSSGYLFGGLSASRSQSVQFAMGGDGNLKGQGAAPGVFSGGLSGVAFAEGIRMVSRVTQGCLPLSKGRVITAAQNNLVLELDGEPALDVLLRELGVTLEQPQTALSAVRATLVGLLLVENDAAAQAVRQTGNFGDDVLVRHIIGLDPVKRGVAIAGSVAAGMQLAFCQRNVQAARADLMRVCTEIREELEPEEVTQKLPSNLIESQPEPTQQPKPRISGAVYVSCAGRGGPHFGADSAELKIVRQALGDVPLVGFFAGGEIAHNHLYGYTAVLTVFVA
ncbi:MAG: FIST N-terminal domain-containing protein [Burkholderiaceae bacterium]